MGSRLNHQREITWASVTEFDAELGRPTLEATVVIAPWNPYPAKEDYDLVHWAGTAQGWTRVYVYENGERHWAMWRRTSVVAQSNLERHVLKAR
jgi:hypothetical protein